MSALEIAVSMYRREHDRWNQWALFLFGSIISLFVIWGQLKQYLPLCVLSLLAFLLSCMWVLVALSIRASTYAWRETIKELECNKDQEQPFHIFNEKLNSFSRCKDFGQTLAIWRTEPYLGVTRLLTLFGVLAAILFLLLFLHSLLIP